MDSLIVKFAAETESSAEGISALGLNLKGFIFQLITFLLVLLVLSKYVFPKLTETMEKRRQVLEQSLVDARKAQEALAKTEEDVSKILSQARQQADQALADANSQAKEIIAKAEAVAGERAERVIKEAKTQIDQERSKLREELKGELVSLVTATTEKVLQTKLDTKEDARLVEQSIKEVV